MENLNQQNNAPIANYKPYKMPCKGCGHEAKRTTRNPYSCHICKNKKKYCRDWKLLRLRVLERDDGRCLICKRSDIKMHIHHVDGNRKNNSMDNLQTKCYQCHISNHKNAGYEIKDIKYYEFGVRIKYFGKEVHESLYKL